MGIALVVSIAWHAQTRRALEAEKAQRLNQDEQIKSLAAQIQSLESQLSQAKQQNQTQMGTELSRIAELKAKLAAQKDLADQAKQRLEDARSNARPTGDSAALQERLKQEKSYIDELGRKLQQHHQQESQLSSQNKTELQQMKFQQQEDRLALDAKIRNQETIIQGTLEKLDQHKGRKDFIGKEETQKLRDELKAEKTALSDLNSQKRTWDRQWRQEQALSTDQTHLSQQELKEYDQKLRQTLQQEQGRFQAMQRELSSTQKESQTKQDEIKKLEVDYQQQSAKATQLEAALRNEQEALQQISH